MFAIGTLGYGDAALESGFSIISGQLFKRHTQRTSGLFYGYDFFMLGGIGKNSNLLGSSLADFNTSLIFNTDGQSGFQGLGFGVQNEFLPHALSNFNNRKGKLLMRFSNANHSMHLVFINDMKLGRVFYGQGTDYGATGALSLGYSQIHTPHEASQVHVRLALFTPKPDYSKTPNNAKNSDDGRKNVWHTLPPFENLFYANLSVSASYQYREVSASANLGINSQKLGAYIQNTLHDGPGLNPRFPWNVKANDKLFFETSGSFIKTKHHGN